MYVQPDAWCHKMMLKGQRHGQMTVIVAANITLFNPISVGYMKNKICLVNESNK